MRVDGATAPLLLDWWARQPRRSEPVFAALGRRGEWLASLNPDWHKPVAATETSLRCRRRCARVRQEAPSGSQVLTTVRRQDPARALALVESTWQSDGANVGQRFLEAFREPSMADEPSGGGGWTTVQQWARRRRPPFSRPSRVRLPAAALGHAAKPIITVRESWDAVSVAAGGRFVLVPPESFAVFWERDGIEERPPEGVGPRAWWMRQILARADLAVWTELTRDQRRKPFSNR